MSRYTERSEIAIAASSASKVEKEWLLFDLASFEFHEGEIRKRKKDEERKKKRKISALSSSVMIELEEKENRFLHGPGEIEEEERRHPSYAMAHEQAINSNIVRVYLMR